MKIVADVNVLPIGTKSSSISHYVADCLKSLAKETGILYHMHACGTNIEGDYDTVMKAVRHCIEKLHQQGVEHLDVTIHVMSRTDKEMSIKQCRESVSLHLNEP